MVELTPEDLEALVSELHNPSVDHMLLPSEYDVSDEDGQDYSYPVPDYYQAEDADEDINEQQIEQLKQLENLLEGKHFEWFYY